MMNFSDDIDVYDIYARVVTENLKLTPNTEKKYSTFYVGRRDGAPYKHSSEEILAKYKDQIVWHDRMPDILSSAMGNEFFMCRFEDLEEGKRFTAFAME